MNKFIVNIKKKRRHPRLTPGAGLGASQIDLISALEERRVHLIQCIVVELMHTMSKVLCAKPTTWLWQGALEAPILVPYF